MDNEKMKVNSKIKFVGEKQRYTIQAINDDFAICTKPFNLKKTTIYTVVDFKRNIRGTENLIFPRGAETKEQCEAMLTRLVNKETDISHRNNIPLQIENQL